MFRKVTLATTEDGLEGLLAGSPDGLPWAQQAEGGEAETIAELTGFAH